MQKRNPALVFFLVFLTLGIYAIVWYVSTKEEMNKRGAAIPTAWLLIVPFVNILWMWKYSAGVSVVTKKEVSDILAFLLLLALGPIGMAVLQSKYNEV